MAEYEFAGHSTEQAAVCAERHCTCTIDHVEHMNTSRRYYVNSTGYPSESVSCSKWHVWFASHLSTWHRIAASCPAAASALSQRSDLCGAAKTQQLRRLPVQLRYLDSKHHLQTVQTTAEGSPFSGNMNTALCDF